MTKLVRIMSAGLIITTTVVIILTTVVIILTLRLIKSHKNFAFVRNSHKLVTNSDKARINAYSLHS